MATSIVLCPVAERRAGYVTTTPAAEVGPSRQQLSYLARTGSPQRDLPTDLRPTPFHLATNDAGTTRHLGRRLGILRQRP